jgi:superfamily I DNA and/or RNA helicase
MLLSLVGGTGQVGRLLQDERRLNVALTCARHKLLLLGDARELRADPLYGRLLAAVAPPAPGDDMATGTGI